MLTLLAACALQTANGAGDAFTAGLQIAPGGRAMILAELDAAEASIASGVYIVWRTSRSGAGRRASPWASSSAAQAW